MGPAPECGIYHTPRKKDFTENWRHESQTSRTVSLALRLTFLGEKEKQCLV